MSTVPSPSYHSQHPLLTIPGDPPAKKHPKHAVYLETDCVEFPVTGTGSEVMKKLVVYNKDTCDHKVMAGIIARIVICVVLIFATVSGG